MDRQMVAIQRELKALRREVRRQRRRAWLIPIVALLSLLPLAAQAANPFNDLNPGSVHNANIDAIYNAHVTTGCVPNVSYCPNNNVTREEMASFLARLGGLGSNPPVANAKTALTATNAQNAATLNNFAANGLVRANVGGSGMTTIAVSGFYQTVASVAITLPGPGLVYVTGTVSFQSAPGGSSQLSPVAAQLRDSVSSLTSYPEFSWVGNLAGSSVEQSITPTWVFQATSGGVRSFAIEVARDPTSVGSASAFNGVVSALFVPFGPGGALASGQEDTPGGFPWPPAVQP